MRKTPASESFFDKVSGWRLETLLKKRIRRKCFFSVIVAAFLNKRYWTKARRSQQEVFCGKDVLRNSAKFKIPKACIFIKKEALTQVFSCEFC